MISQLGFLNERLFVAWSVAAADFVLLAVCVLYLMQESQVPGWYDRRGNQLALGVGCHMLGEVLNRSWGAVLLVMYTWGWDIAPLENAYPVAFTGSIISVAGILCKIRVLSPGVWWQRWLWIAAMVLAFASGIVGMGLAQWH